VSIATQPGAQHAVLVTGYGTSSGDYTLRWNYAAASSTPSATATPTWAAATGALGLSCATIAHDAHRTSRRTRT
jgi:hypothetical protein